MDRPDGRTRKLGRNVARDARESEDTDIEHLARALHLFQLEAGEMTEPQVQPLARNRFLGGVMVTLQLVADRDPNEISPI